ncbi:sigma-54 dependent transcriptional regulator [Paracoccus sp. WLY502]|uniref:sigma-54-dependent transcriptional regulator n=1 Tax=Paracoccus yibinensis TaxID=3068891 RepID=UPI00279668CA|nr:sigma-54 dependent transcriptional regulator [Paracoccus sp. WLY502]MDQ1898866.1 sigma-54 dependent transcriptional regulator [Paracoccus sp. WLY502]
MTGLVRLVDDDEDLRAAQVQTLQMAGLQVEDFGLAEDALKGVTRDYPGVVLSDVRMPGMDGLQLFQRLHAIDADLPVILLTGHGDVPMAVAALKAGAYDFLTKPVSRDVLLAAVNRAVSARALILENRQLRQASHDASDGFPELAGGSEVMVHLRAALDRVAVAEGSVLLTGPQGVGKLTVARAIHRQGPRRARAFVHLACDAVDEARFDADLLGSDAPGPRGTRQAGQLERAQRGVLFLDRVDALTPPMQARLAAILEAGEFWPAGAAAPRAMDVQLLASTTADPARLAEGPFDARLFYRLSGTVLPVPPLAERREDIPALYRHFLLAACARLDRPAPEMTGAVKARLSGHGWPGNLPELRGFAESQAIGVTPFDAEDGGDPPGLSELVAAYERELIRDALRLSGGNATAAMGRLQLPRKTFYDKLARHGIRPTDFRR